MEARSVADVLREMLATLDSTGETVVRADELASWPEGGQEHLEDLGILQPAESATRAVCHGCDEGCIVIPQMRRRAGREAIYIHPCHVHDYGHIHFGPEVFQRWSLDLEALAHWLGANFELKGEVRCVVSRQLWLLGHTKGHIGGRPVYFSWGYTGPGGDDRARIAAERIIDDQAMLIVPARKPPLRVWPEQPKHIYPLTEMLMASDDLLDLDDALVRRLLKRRPSSLRPVRLPDGTPWEKVVIRILDDEHAEIHAGPIRENRSFAEMGMGDRRKREREPTSAWLLLLTLAQHHGSISWADRPADSNIKSVLKALRHGLRSSCGIEDDPFRPYSTEEGWAPRFVLTDLRPE